MSSFQKIKGLTFFQFNVIKQLLLPNSHCCKSMFILIEMDMLFCRPLETTCKAEDVCNRIVYIENVSTFIVIVIYIGEKILGVYIDGDLTTFGS